MVRKMNQLVLGNEIIRGFEKSLNLATDSSVFLPGDDLSPVTITQQQNLI